MNHAALVREFQGVGDGGDQLGRLGDTGYEIGQLQADLEGALIVPVSVELPNVAVHEQGCVPEPLKPTRSAVARYDTSTSSEAFTCVSGLPSALIFAVFMRA